MIEIRCYHYLPEKFEAYKKWAIDEAVPFLKENLDVVGFWVDNGLPPEITGEDPADHKHGVANITWIIKWKSESDRATGMKEVLGGSSGRYLVETSRLKGYLQMEARFAEEL